ncbi:alcohol dehydrogenase [Mollisia scopiformis]|uniref:Alcohol dehydrogenase n=1 Tax=Mollisia scopiformis TaxID=149040 RepID=A0A194XI31_MOLSC|nr:alcohol dehydrogenase [Mollisia scopiformis]KUJ19818.1 alcohol dehydrogenase [Mollisia scopiformis]
MGSLEAAVNRAIIYSDPPTSATQIVELPIEKPGPGQVLVRLFYSGVCHTDLGFCSNSFGLPNPAPKGQVGGHEGVGEVVEQGPGVTTPAIGAKVGVKYAADACLNCDNCLVGGETSCPSVKVSGYYTPGTFQQYVVSSATYLTPIPDGIDLAGAGPLMCGGITVYTALKRAGTRFGDWVLVSGAGGGLGHLAIQYAKAIGAQVIALDHGSKKSFCEELGADAFVDFTKFETDEELKEEVWKISKSGVKTVLCCVSGNRAYEQSMDFLGFRGTLVCLGVPPAGGLGASLASRVNAMIMSELTIFAIKSGNRQDAKECLDIAARGLVKTHYKLRGMDELTAIFHEMEEGTISGRVVIDLR